MDEIGEVIFLAIVFGVPIYVFRRIVAPMALSFGLIGGGVALGVWMNENPAAAAGFKEDVFTLAKCFLLFLVLQPVIYAVFGFVDKRIFGYIDRLSRRRPGED